jgi:hypothetical protein
MSTKKKSTKTTSQMTKKPTPHAFDHKAKKGKVRVHLVIVVDEKGKRGAYIVDPRDPNDDLDRAIGGALDNAEIAYTAYDVYHIDQTFDLPKRIAKKAKKTRTKKILSERPESHAGDRPVKYLADDPEHRSDAQIASDEFVAIVNSR